MTETTKQTPTETKKSLDRLRALRDEVIIKMHLAEMEAKDRWRALEPTVTALVDEVDKGATALVDEADKGATDLTRGVVSDAIKALEKLRASIR